MLMLGEKMLEAIEFIQRQHKEPPRLQNYSILSFYFRSCSKSFQSTSLLYVNQGQ